LKASIDARVRSGLLRKRQRCKPLEHVFATRDRALEFGGTFAQTIFCVGKFHDANKRRTFDSTLPRGK
jgi:hypothetical protein